MHKSILPYPKVPQLSKTDIAYATADARLEEFYAHKAIFEGFDAILAEKKDKKYPRTDLATVLRDQYLRLPDTQKALEQIAALERDHTWTVVTAHQPALLLGPLYFIYKAITAINMAEALNERYAGKQQVVPVFVLGSEDHDLAELNHAGLFGKKIVWEPEQSGAVGRMHTDSLAPVLEQLKSLLGDSAEAAALYERVAACYQSPNNTFAQATQALLHTFLGKYGLLVLDMSDARLKRHFIPVLRDELTRQSANRLVTETIARLSEKGFKPQAPPREINLFYMADGLRERIVREEGVYKVLNTDLVFSEAEILDLVEQHPEYFSPNVVLRPLFQEMILPNLAYVGGGGELAYWLERRTLFAHFGVSYPILLRRHSALWLDRDALKKLEKFGFTPEAFFADTDALIREFVAKNAAAEVSLEQETGQLRQLFEQIAAKAKAIDPTLEKAVMADAVKSVGQFEQWQSRLVRAEKQKHETTLNQLRNLKEKLFPGNGLQERSDNFLPFVLKYGDTFIEALKANFQAFDPGFVILSVEG